MSCATPAFSAVHLIKLHARCCTRYCATHSHASSTTTPVCSSSCRTVCICEYFFPLEMTCRLGIGPRKHERQEMREETTGNLHRSRSISLNPTRRLFQYPLSIRTPFRAAQQRQPRRFDLFSPIPVAPSPRRHVPQKIPHRLIPPVK